MDKLFLTVFIAVLTPVYLHEYGIQNFLWFSDISLFLIFFGLWLESTLLISIAALLSLFMELFWSFEFFHHLITGETIINLSGYMFDPEYSPLLRGLSLFHLLLPIYTIRYLITWGYNVRAINYAVPILWIVLIVCYAFTPVSKNINWVYSPYAGSWLHVSYLQWVLLQMAWYPIVIMIPKNLLFKKLFKNTTQRTDSIIRYKQAIIRHMSPKTLRSLQSLQTWFNKAG